MRHTVEMARAPAKQQPLRVLDLDAMRALPWPSEPQRAAFAAHVAWAHSWYNHLPFEAPTEFVLFLADDAGAGFETQKRLHHGWKTTDDYRRRFGLLDFAWRLPGEQAWRRDAGADVVPSPALLAAAGFTLGPTCSGDFNAIEVLCARYARELPAGDPRRPAFETLERQRQRVDDAYMGLTEDERRAVAAADMGHPGRPDGAALLTGAAVRGYRDEQGQLSDHFETMRAPGRQAISDALVRLGAACRR
jgi:hypothetical protein